MAVLLTVSWPLFPAFNSRELELTAQSLAFDLRRVQQEAVVTGENCQVTFYVFNDSYRMELPGGNIRIYLPEGISYEGTTTFPGNPAYVRFNYMGRPSSGGTIILETMDKERFYVIVAPINGRIRISQEPPDSWS